MLDAFDTFAAMPDAAPPPITLIVTHAFRRRYVITPL